MRKSDKRVWITAQLIEAQEGTQLWAEGYEHQLKDVFAIQNDGAQSIARELKVAFSRQATAMVRSFHSTNFDA